MKERRPGGLHAAESDKSKMIFTQDRVNLAVGVRLEMRVVTIHIGTKSGQLSTSAWSSGDTDTPMSRVCPTGFGGHLIVCGWISVLRERVWMERGILENPSVKIWGRNTEFTEETGKRDL